jgi:hypothetical protein
MQPMTASAAWPVAVDGTPASSPMSDVLVIASESV